MPRFASLRRMFSTIFGFGCGQGHPLPPASVGAAGRRSIARDER
ncbi:hypothetical protein C4K18_0622 [Pseudomonas chlororaphis subsp. aurantiaca]|nr:hypothetical protein C4K18_0622 [Pseudomonas chlororaphis subsp. aurantiaca]